MFGKRFVKWGCIGVVVLMMFFLVPGKINNASTMPNTDSTTQTNETQDTQKQIEELLATMTLREKICQMLFVTPERIAGGTSITKVDETVAESMRIYPVGGILYSVQNLVSQEQTAQMIADTQALSTIPLFIAADEEGGTVNRLMKKLGTTYIGSMYDYKDQGVEIAYQNAYTIASDMASIGFTLDFAPVADVWSNPKNKVIGKRAYSDDYEEAARLVSTAVSGFQDGGVMCTLKHFPGHGDTVEDSHKVSVHVNKTKEELYAQELQPFVSGIAANAEFVMMGHVIVDSLDPENPASLSPVLIQDVLRKDLGFEGVVITDALQMKAISDQYTVEETAIKAVLAGNDMLLEPVNVERTIDALMDAVAQGIISEERIDESVRRILKLKVKE